MLAIGVVKNVNEEKRGVLLQIFSRAMALVSSLTGSKTKNCLLAAVSTFCNKFVQLSFLLIFPKCSIFCAEKDWLLGSSMQAREKYMEKGKGEDHRIDDRAFGSLNVIYIKV